MKIVSILLLTALALFATPNIGDKAVNFTLPNLYNHSVKTSSKALQGKVTLINIWASWCSGCQEEMPLLVQLQENYSKDKFEVILVNIDSQGQNAIDFLDYADPQKHLTALYDTEKSLAKAYRCPGMPSSILIDQKGNIAGVYIGSFHEKSIKKLKNNINQLIGK